MAKDLTELPEGFQVEEVKLVANPEAMGRTKKFEAEKYTDKIYRDTVGKRTIGYGFNIDDPSVSKLLPNDVIKGRRPLSQQEAEPIFQKLYGRAQKDAYDVIGADTYLNLPPQIADVVDDMSYNMGRNRLSGFKKAISALQEGNYSLFAKEIKNSKWFNQVGRRSKFHVDQINQYVKSQIPQGRVEVIAKDGTIGHVPSNQLAQAIKSGYKRNI